MKIIKNEKLIQRNGKIGEWTSIGGIAISGIAMYFLVSTMLKPETATVEGQYKIFGLMLVGLVLSFVSNSFSRRFGRSPRPDEKLDTSLKGLHSEFSIYHYSSPVSHLLVGPSGVWVLLPYHQRGTISFEKNRWKMKGGGFLQGYMRIFGQENLGRPELDAENEVRTLQKFFAKKLNELDIPEIKPVLVFTTDEVELDAGDSPIAAMKLKQLKEFMRQGGKNRALNSEQIKKLTDVLEA